jgi:pyruvate dehydrogenase E2 component (dihydrolipoamide acetyltransferase)
MAGFIYMIALSPTMEQGTIIKWNVKKDDKIENGKILCEVETDKATMEYESMDEGTLLEIILPAGSKAKVGDPIAVIGNPGEDYSDLMKNISSGLSSTPASSSPAVKTDESPSKATEKTLSSVSQNKVIVSPLARVMADQNGLDLSLVEGTGPGGRIVKRDIEKALSGGGLKSVKPVSTGAQPVQKLADEDIEIEISQKRRVIARKLSESMFSAPHFYLKITALSDELLDTREKINQGLKDDKISFNAYLIKIAAEAIRKHPVINSSWMETKIIQHGSIDIGLAVALDDGLVTPIVRNCGNKGIREIDQELKTLIQKAKSGKISLDEITGATFTISNLGSFDIDEFTAIINPPGAAILAVGKVNKEPVVNDQDQIEIRRTIRFTLSCDHRIIDGSAGALFLNTFKKAIEQPLSILL